MMLASMGQLGGSVGGVGQSLAIAWPIQGDYLKAIALPGQKELLDYCRRDRERFNAAPQPTDGGRVDPEVLQHQFVARMLAGGTLADKVKEAQLQRDIARKSGHPVEAARAHQRYQALLVELSAFQQQAANAVIVAHRLLDAQEALQQAKQPPSDKVMIAWKEKAVQQAEEKLKETLNPATYDDTFWAALVAVVTIALLYPGKYGIVQNLSTAMVVVFTFITVGNVLALQTKPAFALSLSDLGHAFGLPERSSSGVSPLATALATFGIIGVGASELVAYPYWCLEKGYSRFTGPRSDEPSWAERARGWLRVMLYDSFLSMVLYTVATLAFFIMGAAVLHRQGLDPDGMRMVSTLLEQYRPVFGEYARWLFLIGAIAVLYSTFLVANAGHSRTYTDFFMLCGLLKHNPVVHRRSISALSVILPLLSLAIFCSGANPVTLVKIGGFMQATMLPMLGFAAVYFRYRRTDERLKPGRLWDLLLVVSCLGLVVAGAWGGYENIAEVVRGWGK
jgi:hypothetical protein